MVSKVLCLGSFGGWRVWNTCQPLAFLAALEKTYLVELPHSSCHSFHLRFGNKILLSISFFFLLLSSPTLELNFEAILELEHGFQEKKSQSQNLIQHFEFSRTFFSTGHWQSSNSAPAGRTALPVLEKVRENSKCCIEF